MYRIDYDEAQGGCGAWRPMIDGQEFPTLQEAREAIRQQLGGELPPPWKGAEPPDQGVTVETYCENEAAWEAGGTPGDYYIVWEDD